MGERESSLPPEITAAIDALIDACEDPRDTPRRTARARLEALIAGLVEWQPIETAPRDGSELILGQPGCSYPGFWSTEECRRLPSSPEGNWFEEYQRLEVVSSRPSHPTHWRPLPPPPTTQAKDGSVR